MLIFFIALKVFAGENFTLESSSDGMNVSIGSLLTVIGINGPLRLGQNGVDPWVILFLHVGSSLGSCKVEVLVVGIRLMVFLAILLLRVWGSYKSLSSILSVMTTGGGGAPFQRLNGCKVL